MIRARRLATARAHAGTLLLSTGTPMLLAGDERWRTQRGNNNAYCLDDETSWLDWADEAEAGALTAFTARVAAIRRVSRPCTATGSTATGEVLWWHPTGRRLRGRRLARAGNRTRLGLLRAEWLLLLHAGDRRSARRCRRGGPFTPVVDSARRRPPVSTRPLPGGTTITLPPRSLAAPAPRRPARAVAPPYRPPAPTRRARARVHHVHEPRKVCTAAPCTAVSVPFDRAALRLPLPCVLHHLQVDRPMAAAGDPARCPLGHTDTVKLLSTVALGGRAAGGRAPVPAAPAGGGGCCGGGCCS